MDKLTHYRQLIQDFLLQRENQNLSYGDVETEVADSALAYPLRDDLFFDVIR